ncbi:tRNA-splicing endonuclease subunit Sen54 [Lutzomyia longipalpis]|uniref:tRNA-splicing endonuclease subunit Sen54 n=1 Tax=Lutzomyia longipalpis TaxID=7200 RepID=UPI00248332F8|nr:tRNA-splicing endonuclease subunit Sen54 [Lutzomyia longipalpis]
MENSQELKLLSAKDLAQKSTENTPSISSYTPGSKKNSLDRSDQEVAKLAELHDNLKEVLSLERVGTENTRIIADYNSTTGQIRLRKISGTLQSFGQTNELNETYLEPYEALYLLEMNRLIIFQNTVVMSLEEAYEIFLNHESLSLEEYFIFSFLNKLGYIVKKFNTNTTYNAEKVSDIECTESSSGSKRKNISNECGISKKLKGENLTQSYTKGSIIEHLIDEATEEQCSENLKSSFASFSIVHLTSGGNKLTTENNLTAGMRKLSYAFDLYNPRKIFRKSQPPPPDYRVVFSRFDQAGLSRDELMNLHESHELKCPILAIYIDDHLKISGFLYKFA